MPTPTVNSSYPYTETDIQELISTLLKQRGLHLTDYGTIFAGEKIYTVGVNSKPSTVTIAEPQLIDKTTGKAEPYKANKLNASVKEILNLTKDSSTKDHVLLFPLYLNNNHWVLIYVFFTSSAVTEVNMYNTLLAFPPIDSIRKLINPIFEAHLKSNSLLFKYLSSATNYPFYTPPCDRQPDGVSCGVFIVKFIEGIFTSGKIKEGKRFTSEEVYALRQQHVDVAPHFAERQFHAKPADTKIVALASKPNSSIFVDITYEAFAEYILSLPSADRELFIKIAREFIDAEQNLEVLNTPTGSIDAEMFATLQAIGHVYESEIKEWFSKHAAKIDAKLFSTFFEQDANQLKWQSSAGQIDGKDALLAFLPKACDMVKKQKNKLTY